MGIKAFFSKCKRKPQTVIQYAFHVDCLNCEFPIESINKCVNRVSWYCINLWLPLTFQNIYIPTQRARKPIIELSNTWFTSSKYFTQIAISIGDVGDQKIILRGYCQMVHAWRGCFDTFCWSEPRWPEERFRKGQQEEVTAQWCAASPSKMSRRAPIRQV